MGMTVALTGATGFVGRRLCRELLARGHKVRALVRSRGRAMQVLPTDPGLTLIGGEVSDAARVGELLQGAGACINLIGILRERRGEAGGTFRAAHVDSVRSLVKACEALGVGRFVQMSALGVSELGPAEYQKTKFEGEQIVRRSSLAWTIFRPSLIHGSDGEFIQMCKAWAGGHAAPWLFMPYFRKTIEEKSVPLGPLYEMDPMVQPVAVEDVVTAFANALEREPTVGEVYNLVGGEALSFPDLLRHIRDHVHGANPDIEAHGIPGWLGAGVARAAALAGAGGLLPFDEGMALMGAEDATGNAAKASAHLGIEFKAFRAAFEGYAGAV
ncbi:MAG: NAD(P)H-binding protein [Phycisphaerales bacterium]|nr:NAD(P)H-binding protein [Phycisphaerales bacterium]